MQQKVYSLEQLGSRTHFYSGFCVGPLLQWVLCWPTFIVGFVLVHLQFYVQCFVDRCLSLFFLLMYFLVRFTASDYPFGFFNLQTIILSILLRFRASDYPLRSSNFITFISFVLALYFCLKHTTCKYLYLVDDFGLVYHGFSSQQVIVFINWQPYF